MYTGQDLIGVNGICKYDKTIGCKSSNVVYGIWCDICRIVVYVGETGDILYRRFQNHMSTIRSDSHVADLPVPVHFRSAGHSAENVKLVGLERVWKNTTTYRRLRETRWMYILGTTRLQGGLNKKIA